MSGAWLRNEKSSLAATLYRAPILQLEIWQNATGLVGFRSTASSLIYSRQPRSEALAFKRKPSYIITAQSVFTLDGRKSR